MLLLKNRAGLKDVFTGFYPQQPGYLVGLASFLSITVIIETCGILLDGKVMVDV